MQLTIEKNELLKALTLPISVASHKTTIPILGNVLLDATSDLRVVGTDLELAIHNSTSAVRIKKAGSITLPAKRLFDFVRLLPDGDIDLTTGDNHWATLRCGRSKTRIAGTSAESFPEVPRTVPAAAFTIPAETLRRMIRCTQMSISREESRFTLSGAFLEISGERAKMVTTDGHRMSIMGGSAKTDLKPPHKLIPVGALKILSGLSGSDPVAVSFDDNHLYFKSGDTLLIARIMAGNFPDYTRVLPNGSHTKTVTVNREELKAGLQRIAQFSDERSRSVRLEFEAGEIKLFASAVESGESEESIPATSSNLEGSISVGFNVTYLLDLIGVIEGETVTFNLQDAKSAALINHGDGGVLTYLCQCESELLAAPVAARDVRVRARRR